MDKTLSRWLLANVLRVQQIAWKNPPRWEKEVIVTARESPSSDEAKPIAACVTLRACLKALPAVVHDAP